MNAARRKAINDACDAMRKAIDAFKESVETCKTDLEAARDEEQEYYDNMPENFQQGERGEAAEQAVTELDEVINALDEIELDGIVDTIESFENDRSF